MARDEFATLCQDLLAPLGSVRGKRMFGGYGIWLDGLIVALVIGQRLYLKTDEQSRDDFAAQGGEPFVYEARGKRVTLPYWTAPAEAMESPALMQPWGILARQAALRAQARNAASGRSSRKARRSPRTRT